MKILTLLGFIVFFGLGVPAFLYWFGRFSKDLMTKDLPFIGFPEDGTKRPVSSDTQNSWDETP
jgi:hypothetical protein